MKTIYEQLLHGVADGKPFKIDFKKRNMQLGSEMLIRNGEWNIERDLILYATDTNNLSEHLRTQFCLDIIECLYQDYISSTPSERSESRRHYFYAKPAHLLTDEEMINGLQREYARAKLEGFILCSVLNEWLTWNDITMGKWFWQSKIHKDLVILKEWITE